MEEYKGTLHSNTTMLWCSLVHVHAHCSTKEFSHSWCLILACLCLSFFSLHTFLSLLRNDYCPFWSVCMTLKQYKVSFCQLNMLLWSPLIFLYLWLKNAINLVVRYCINQMYSVSRLLSLGQDSILEYWFSEFWVSTQVLRQDFLNFETQVASRGVNVIFCLAEMMITL